MSSNRGLGVILPVLLLYASALTAQEAAPPATASSRIDLGVVVRPAAGRPVTNLQQRDFTILDNKTPRPITSFHSPGAAQMPVHVVLVVDAVNTNYSNIAYQRGQIDKFLRANGGQLAQPTALAIFTDQGIKLQQDFATDGNELSGSFDSYAIGLRDIRRSSQYGGFDRFDLSINALRELVATEAPRPGRKMILWVSPGWPLLSGPGIQLDFKQEQHIFATIVELSTQLRQGNITLYSIDPLGATEGVGRTSYYETFLKGVSKVSQVQMGDLALQVLAAQTGGLVLNSSNDVSSLLEQCMEDATAYYEVSFDPPVGQHRDEYHSLEIRLNSPGLTARTRTGYYAQP
jgi:VWFA-related protein